MQEQMNVRADSESGGDLPSTAPSVTALVTVTVNGTGELVGVQIRKWTLFDAHASDHRRDPRDLIVAAYRDGQDQGRGTGRRRSSARSPVACPVSAGLWTRQPAVLATGAVMCWGADANGELGDGRTLDSPMPVRVLGIP